MTIFEKWWGEPAMSSEQRLWMAVLKTALHDALSGETPSVMETAKRWFREGGQHFQMVCDLASCDASLVREKALSVLDQEPAV
ncbi:MAG: hypothetical protein HQL87_12610 [Magnetococcales bacterium]|nr:hypothetical protein [Magnetococcales bacterium]